MVSRKISITADIAKRTFSGVPTATQNDDIELTVDVTMDGAHMLLDDVKTATLVSTRLDQTTIVDKGEIIGPSQIFFKINRRATSMYGSITVVIQLYDDVLNRVSTIRGIIELQKDATGETFVPLDQEKTLIVEVLENGPTVIEAARTATIGALEATENAITESNNLEQLKSDITDATNDASNAATLATEKATTAEEKAIYADEQGTRAKVEADRLAGTDVSTLDNKITNVTAQLADTVSYPRYTYNPTLSYDILLAQMREETFRESNIVLNRDNSLTYFEVIRRINQSGGAVTLRIEADYNGTITPTVKRLDTIGWTGVSSLSAPTMVSDGVWEKVIDTAALTKPFVGFGIQILTTEPSTTFAIIKKISMIQDGVELVNNDLFRYIAGFQGAIPNGQINVDYGYRGYLSAVSNSIVNAPRVVYVRPNGLSSGLGNTPNKAISWEYFSDSFYPIYKDYTDFVILSEGIYRVKGRAQLLKITTAQKMTFICPKGKALFDCGEEKPTTSWTSVSGSDFISVPYDPTNHWNASVRGGTQAPIITFLESGTKTRIKLTKVNTQVECQNTDGSYFYDFTNKKFYINWKDGVSYFISIPELQSGFRIENKEALISFVNIEVRSAETAAFFIIPTSYGKGKIYWFNCVGGSSGTGDDFKIQYIDTDIVNCRSVMSGNDGFNFHFEGISNIVNCEAWGAFNDGMSHHENTKGFVWNYRALNNGTSASTPAYGAFVYHENCYSEGNGFDNIRPYSGGYALLGGSGYARTTAIYINCKSVNDERGFVSAIQSDSGGNEAILIAHNGEIVNPSGIGYATENGATLKSIHAHGVKTTSGENITLIA